MIEIVKKYLLLNNFSQSLNDFEDVFLSHPNYPSIFAITDTLNMLSIENIALKVPKEQFEELPNFFLAIYNDNLTLTIKNISNVTIETENGKNKVLNYNEFLSGWNDVIIVIEPNANLVLKKEKINLKWLFYTLPVFALILLSVVFNHHTINSTILLIISLTGLLISVFIIQEKLGIKNEIASKFCSINTNISCNSVIKSEKSEINQWIGFTDLPLLFFSISVLAIIIQPEQIYIIIGLISLASTPVIIYSLWLQKFKLKKWCVLCLAVSVIILIQSLVFSFAITLINISKISIFSFLLSTILLVTIWLLVKPILESKIKIEKEVIDFKKFKRNFEVFNFMSKDIPLINGFNQLEGLQFGNLLSPVKLTIIISPSCGHCHKAFKDGLDLVKKFPERVSLHVLFNINPENIDNPYKLVVETLLAISFINPENAESAISDWHIKKMELKNWLENWNVKTNNMKVNHEIHQQYQWCLENKFNYTPVKIVNEKLIPNEYEINELKYFLNNFSEIKQENYLLEKVLM